MIKLRGWPNLRLKAVHPLFTPLSWRAAKASSGASVSSPVFLHLLGRDDQSSQAGGRIAGGHKRMLPKGTTKRKGTITFQDHVQQAQAGFLCYQEDAQRGPRAPSAPPPSRPAPVSPRPTWPSVLFIPSCRRPQLAGLFAALLFLTSRSSWADQRLSSSVCRQQRRKSRRRAEWCLGFCSFGAPFLSISSKTCTQWKRTLYLLLS